jgi:putative inorganic carbon (hco3(-)) transporter
MSERLAFGYGTSGHSGSAPSPDKSARAGAPQPFTPVIPAEVSRRAALLDKPDGAFIGLMIFTAVLFFRPQDQIPGLHRLHLAELSAIGALIAMALGRLSRGLTISRITPELCGVVVMGGVIVGLVPFSIWPRGSLSTFMDLYSKIILIFMLMVNTLTSRKRIEQFIWLIVVASGYIALRAVIDGARGINLVEDDRVKGAIGGMFRNPNDLALNMVAVMPLAATLALRGIAIWRRAGAALCTLLMIGAVIASKSRSGTIGLVAMTSILALYLLRRKPGAVGAGVLAVLLALPLVPTSYWHRLSSITDETQDQTGSREARRILLRESFTAFIDHPLTGVGAGQFRNYDPEGREQPWRESHNILLQVGAELGILGLSTLLFLIFRAGIASTRTRRLLRRARGVGRRPSANSPPPLVTPAEAAWFQEHAAAMSAALAGWFCCALFASVAYNWTFYYLLALATTPQGILEERLAPLRRAKAVREPVSVYQGAQA